MSVLENVVLAATALALVHPMHAAGAQTGGRATFVFFTGTDTIFVEHRTRTPSRLAGEFALRGSNARVVYDAALTPDALLSHVDITTFANAADVAGTKSSLAVMGDSVIATQGAASRRSKVPAGTFTNVNPSAAFMEQMLMRARAIGGASASFPLLVDPGSGSTVPIVVTWIGADSATIAIATTVVRAAVAPNGELLGGVIPSQRARIVRAEGTTGSVSVAPPDYSAPAGAPYTAQEVTVTTPAGLHFTGTLTVPRVRPAAGAPAVITITGSGPEDRNGTPPSIKEYRLYGELADTLGRRGIAVLRLDDRGMGGSSTGPGTATSADFADDIRAGIAFLRARPEIDRSRIGIVGHSEGGMIAPMIAATDPALRGIVLLAGPASPGKAISMEQNRYQIDSVLHLHGPARDDALARSSKALDSIAAQPGWLGFFLKYDPAPTARRVRTPVLILQGQTDTQVAPAEAQRLADAFRAGGNTDVTVRLFPETNHLFVADASGAFASASEELRYQHLPSLHVRPEVLGAIADWLNAEFRR